MTKLTSRFTLALSLLLLLSAFAPSRADRQDLDWNAGWKFLDSDAEVTADTTNWQSIQMPHTWDVDNYRRGFGWYVKTFEAPTSWKGKRMFVRFEAVSIAADVYLNGEKLDRHEGAFTAFCTELTSHLKLGQSNELRIRADNAAPGIPPYSADFNFCGGIYRPVHLLVTDSVCISPLDFGSSGVYLAARDIRTKSAEVEVKTMVSNGRSSQTKLPVEIEILSANGTRVAFKRINVSVEAGNTLSFTQTFSIARPHLWQGLKDPYLYTVHVRLLGKNQSDEMTQPLGLRTVTFSANEQFLLNGSLYPIHGVNRHQDWKGKAWALTEEDHRTDFNLIKEMGTTTVRLAHYPQSQVFADLCDRGGMLLWEEIPVVNRILDDARFSDNARLQLTEMIKQNGNHPSIMVWGLFNEVTAPGQSTPEVLVKQLSNLAHSLDPTRVTVGASDNPKLADLNHAPDHIGFNIYPGWYTATVEDYRSFIENRSQSMENRRVALSEYGGGASVIQHQEGELTKPIANRGKFHPEEYQTYLHQRAWAQIQNNPHLWGSFVWAMFDFAVARRDEGDRPNINDKGLVTDDRKTRKDAYYFYKANWNSEPMVYVASRRMTPRKLASTQIKVFSNSPEVELFVNGKSLGKTKPDAVHVFRWEKVSLLAGTNKVEAVIQANGKILSDSCEWILEAN